MNPDSDILQKILPKSRKEIKKQDFKGLFEDPKQGGEGKWGKNKEKKTSQFIDRRQQQHLTFQS